MGLSFEQVMSGATTLANASATVIKATNAPKDQQAAQIPEPSTLPAPAPAKTPGWVWWVVGGLAALGILWAIFRRKG